MYCLSPMNLSSQFLNVFKVGAVTNWSGNPFQEEIKAMLLLLLFRRDRPFIRRGTGLK